MFDPSGTEPNWRAGREHPGGSAGGDGGLLDWLRGVVRPRRGTVDARVFVVGTVGTAAVTERLRDVLERRGQATRAVTIDPDEPIQRGRAQRRAVDTLLVDVRADSEALRLARDTLGAPDVLVVTAAGRDGHTGGAGRGDVVRSIAGAVPAGAHVVNAEGAPAVRRYLATAIERRNASISHVGAHDAAAPGAELGSAIDGALAALEQAPMPDEEREALESASTPEWLALPAGRCYDALGVTDVVAIERLRRALCPEGEPVELLVVTAERERDAAATLAEYASECHEQRTIPTVYAAGPLADRFAQRCAAPTVEHGADVAGGHVLDDALAAGPTLVVGSADAPMGEEIETAITERVERSGAPRIG